MIAVRTDQRIVGTDVMPPVLQLRRIAANAAPERTTGRAQRGHFQ